jgi:hypothetical protein
MTVASDSLIHRKSRGQEFPRMNEHKSMTSAGSPSIQPLQSTTVGNQIDKWPLQVTSIPGSNCCRVLEQMKERKSTETDSRRTVPEPSAFEVRLSRPRVKLSQ